MKKPASLYLLFLLPMLLKAQAERNLLTAKYKQSDIVESLTGKIIRNLYPAYEQRQRWNDIDPSHRQKLIAAGEAELNYTWQVVPANSYLEFVRSGERYGMENVFNRNMTAIKRLAFAELAEGKGRFLPKLIDGVWAVCEISSWSLSASLNLQKAGSGLPDIEEPIIELGTGLTCNVMAWVYYLFKQPFDKYNPLIAERLHDEIDRRALQPYYRRNDFWWMALDGKSAFVNNWNVWLNYNVLTCILLVEKDEERKRAGVFKTMRSVDKFINYYKNDGACEEGPAYWSLAGGMLYNYLALLQNATNSKVTIFNDPLIRNIGNYICKAYISDRYYINYADAAAKINPDAGLVNRFGKATADDMMAGFGTWLAHQQNWDSLPPTETMYAGMQNLFGAQEILHSEEAVPLMASAWMKETGIAIARDKAGSTDGFYFSALGGHNAESHNHNDVGSCILFYNGKPVLIDIGSETYTRETFGPNRYSIWTMQSAYHNLPLINGVQQKDGKEYVARAVSFTDDGKSAVFSVDIAGAYPAAAAVQTWERNYKLERGRVFTVSDKYQLSADSGKTELHFMTSAKLQQVKPGLVKMTMDGTVLNMIYDENVLQLNIEPIEIKDARLLQSWAPQIHRLVFTVLKKGNKGSNQIKIVPSSK